MIELKDMSLAQLENHLLEVQAVLASRKKERHIQLAGNVVDAIQALLTEFPTTSLDTEVECPDCEAAVCIDLMDHLKDLTIKDFIY